MCDRTDCKTSGDIISSAAKQQLRRWTLQAVEGCGIRVLIFHCHFTFDFDFELGSILAQALNLIGELLGMDLE